MSSTSSTQKEELGSSEMLKCCSICKTTKTPLWRSGPSGPKSLCNACGIKYRKKTSSSSTSTSTSTSPAKKGKMGKKTKRRRSMKKAFGVNLMVMPKQVELMDQEQQRIPGQHWGEVETAALLLMALSCGAVFA